MLTALIQLSCLVDVLYARPIEVFILSPVSTLMLTICIIRTERNYSALRVKPGCDEARFTAEGSRMCEEICEIPQPLTQSWCSEIMFVNAMIVLNRGHKEMSRDA